MKKIYLLTIVLLAILLGNTQVLFAQTTTFTFNGTTGLGASGIGGSPQTYVVPAGVTSIGVDMYGGCGGWPCCSWTSAGAGGPLALGGRVQCTMNVTPGTTLYVYVGGAGANNYSSGTQCPGGWNGGGVGGASGSSFCAGGGGESDIRTSTTGYSSANVLVVAGAGGGGGDFGPVGGAGGGTIGGAGAGGGACGGGQTGPSCGIGSAGTQGQGGSCVCYSSGGGGAGWWGGNGGVVNNGGGGGGSSYPATPNSVVTAITHTQGYSLANGNGKVVITVLCAGTGTITGATNVCVGGTTTLANPTAASGGTWISSNTAVASIGSTGIVTGVSVGTATITYSVANPCGALATATVTVNPNPTAITGNVNICVGSTSALGSTPSGGTWGSTAPLVASVNSSTGVLTGVSSGTASISYTTTAGCSVTTLATVNNAPAAITGPSVVCPGNTIILSDVTPGGTWSSSNTSLATVSSTGVVTGISGGNPVITYTSTTGCISTAVITVNSMNPILGVLGSCTLGATTTLTDATGGGVWSSSNTSVATIGSSSGVLTTIGYGTSTISYTVSSTGCTATAVEGVTTTAGGTFSMTGGGSYCVGGTGVAVGLSGSTLGVNYQLYNTSGPIAGSNVSGAGFSITFPGSTPGSGVYPAGTYYVVADPGSSCALTMSGSAVITTNPLPTPFTVSGGGSYCAGGTGVHIFLNASTIGVNYQLMLGTTPVGSAVAGTSAALDFGLITTAGTYTVVGTNATTGCINGMANSISVSINSLPTIFGVTGGGGYCTGSTSGVVVGLASSTTGVNYTLYFSGVATSTVVAGTGSAISFGLQTGAGVYTVVATNATTGCTTTMSGSATVVINALPTIFTITGGGAYCSGGTGVHIGLNSSTVGVNYQLYLGASVAGTITAGTGAALDFGLFTSAGSYTVVATNATTGCTANMSGSVAITINPLPSAFTVSGGGSYCAGGAGLHVLLGGSVVGVNYALFNGATLVGGAAGTGASIDFGSQTAAGTYTVVATNTATTCTNTMSGSAFISINPLPLAFAVTSVGTSYCAGGAGVDLGLGGSASGVNYQAFVGGVTSGSSVAGTGTAIDFGFKTTAGAYTVVATTGSGCTANMTGSIAITINPLPVVYTVTGGGGYCSGGTGAVIGLAGSNTGFNYQLLNGTASVGSPVAGTGTSLSFGLQTLTGTYSVVSTNTTTGCTSTMAGTPVVSINPLPVAYTVTVSAASYCAGGAGVHVLLSNSASGVNYQLFNGTTAVTTIAGTGAALDFGFQTAAGTYSVIATNTATGCVNNMTGAPSVTISPLPIAYAVTGGGSYCASGAGLHVGTLASTIGVTYQLYNGPATVGAPVAGTGSALDFGAMTAAGTYTVIATNTITGCTNTMVGSAVITISPLPPLHTLTGGGNYCFGTTGSDIGLNGSETGINYQLFLGAGVVGTPRPGTGSAIDFGLQTTIGTYTIVATNSVSGCTNNMVGSTAVNVNPLPVARIVTGGGNYCPSGAGVRVGLNTSDAGVSYQLYKNGVAVSGGPVAGTGLVLDFGLQTAVGIYTVIATNTTTSCTQAMTGSVTVGISPLPVAYNVTGGGNYCPSGTGVHIGLNGSAIGISYQLFAGASPVGSPLAGSGLPIDFGLTTGTGTYTVVATSAATTCTNNMNGNAVIGISPLPAAHVVTGGGNYCAGGAGADIGLDGSDAGVAYLLFNGTALVGSGITGTGSALDFGMLTAAGTYTVVARGITSTCTSNMTGSAIIGVNPLPAPFTVTGGGNYCAGGTGAHVSLSGSNTGTNYQLFAGSTPAGTTMAGTGTTIDFGSQTIAGIYTVVATDAVTGCSANMTGHVSVGTNPLPVAYAVTGGGNYCTGGAGVHVVLGGSNTGISYQLFNSGSPVGSPIAGTGFTLDFGAQTAVGSYTIVATNVVTGCTSSMTGTVTVAVSPLPSVYSVSSTSSNYCVGGAGVDISLTGSNTGIDYQLYHAGSPVGSAVPGTGSAIDFGYNTLAGTYTVVAVNSATTCSRNMASSVTVVVNALPVAYTVTGGGNYCTGGSGVVVGLSGSNAGVLYQLYNGVTPAGTPVAGTGGTLSFGMQTDGGTYHIVATSPATTCTNNMSGTAVVVVNTLPAPYSVTGGGNYCAGSAGAPVGLSSSATGINYQLFAGSAPVGSAIPGTGSPLDFGTQTIAGTYSVVGTNAATTCTGNMDGTATVVINPLPAPSTVTGGGSYCQGGTGVRVGLSSSQGGISYQLFDGPTPVGSAFTGSGAAINFGLQTVAGTYTVVASNRTTTCTNNMSGSVNVVINSLPVVYNVTGGGNYCATGSGVHVNLNGSSAGVNYQLYNGVTPAGTAVAGTSGILDLGLQTAAGTYTVVATNASTSCMNNMAGAAVVSVTTPVTPVVTLATTAADTLCSGNFTTFTATTLFGGTAPGYRWSINGIPLSVTGTSYGYIPVNGDVITVTLTSSASCVTSTTATNSLTLNVQEQGAPAVAVLADPGNVVCSGSSVTFTATPSFGGSAPAYAWFKGTSNVGSGPSYNYTPANGDIVYCVLTSNYRCRTANTASSTHVTMEVDNSVTPVVTISANPGSKVAPGQSVTFLATVTSGGGTAPSFQWYLNGSPVGGATLSTFVHGNFNNLDSVSCQVTSSGACAGNIGTAGITIHVAGVGVQPVITTGSDITVVPNPSKGIFTVKGSFGSINDEEVTLEVTNMIGQVVYNNKVVTHNGEINEKIQLGNNLANGMYILNLRSDAASKVFHLVIEQ